jgi:hypothetical protein
MEKKYQEVANETYGDVNYEVYVFRVPDGRWGFACRVRAGTVFNFTQKEKGTLFATREEAIMEALKLCKGLLRSCTHVSSAIKPNTVLDYQREVNNLDLRIERQLYDVIQAYLANYDKHHHE